jgi:hypothetical protein
MTWTTFKQNGFNVEMAASASFTGKTAGASATTAVEKQVI